MKKSIWLVIFAFLVLPAIRAQGQMSTATDKMNAQQFEDWVLQIASANQNSTTNPQFCVAVIDRLRAERWTTDRVILRCVESYLAFSTIMQTAGQRIPPERIDAARKFIDDLLSLVSNRPRLKSQLFDRKGTLAVLAGDFTSSAAAFDEALKQIEPFRLEIDLQRVSTLVKLGQSLLSLKKNLDAEMYFLQALSYPWYLVVGHPDEQRALQDQYVLAGQGLIQSRRGNLKALEQTSFVPAMREQLDPALQKAIGEASVRQR